MTARLAKTLSSIVVATMTASCSGYYEIPIETPIRPKLDVSAFQRVLVAGFIAGGTEDVDGNLETTRLLRSQLRTKSEMRVIDGVFGFLSGDFSRALCPHGDGNGIS